MTLSFETSGLTWRQRLALRLASLLMPAAGNLIVWISGLKGQTDEKARDFMRSYVGGMGSVVDGVGQTAARRGCAREGLELEKLFSTLASSLPPDAPWTFHKAEWGKLTVMVMPRTIDSNTGIVLETADERAPAGSTVTCDGRPPNCDPAALGMVNYRLHAHGTEFAGQVDAEFVPPAEGSR